MANALIEIEQGLRNNNLGLVDPGKKFFLSWL
jgi:hypothetical protein